MSDDAPRGDMFAAAQMLAADNARLCWIVLAADKLAEAIENETHYAGLKAALEAYKIQRQGQ
jgi:hypothetical protein